jgi:predicted nucleic acid-binding protein
MNSLDTNILVYASNRAAPEHGKAIEVIHTMLASPSDWIIADQVLWEFYNALRHPLILSKPRTARQAAEQVRFLREEGGVAFCAYEIRQFSAVLEKLQNPRFPYQRTHDAILAVTLRGNGVTTFYTRNTKDFADAGFTHLIDPIA